jgi:membrane associated rhomboid family serine protease
LIPLKANLPAPRLALVTLGVGAASVAAWLALGGTGGGALLFVAGNLVALWVFGSGVEAVLGAIRTLGLLTGAIVLALAVNAIAGAPAPAWTLISAAPTVAAGMALAIMRPRVRVITFSAVPLFGGVTEVPLAFYGAAWLGVEALAIAAW